MVPQFPNIASNRTILEDAPVGSIVEQLAAIDTDANENGRLRYSIFSQAGGDGSPSFTIDTDTGVVTTIETFDRESFAGPYSIIVSVALDYMKGRCNYFCILFRYWSKMEASQLQIVE